MNQHPDRHISIVRALILVLCFLVPVSGFAGAAAGPVVSGTQSVAGPFAPTNTVTYTVVLTNTGPTTQFDNPEAEFDVVLPVSLSLVGANATAGTTVATVGTNTVTWNGSIAPGGTVTITYTATINGAAEEVVNVQGTIHYDINIDGTNDGTAPTDDPNQPGIFEPTKFTIGTIGFTATQTITGTLEAGETVTLTVVVTNTGTRSQSDAVGNEFTEVLPAQFTVVSANATSGTAVFLSPGDEDGGTIRWNGSLAPNQSVTITIEATINSSAAGQIVSTQGSVSFDTVGNGTNDATLPTDDPGTAAPADANTFTLPDGMHALLAAEQTVSTVAAPGAAAVYKVVITNNGTAAQPDNPEDEFFEILPADVSLISASATAGTAVANIGTNTVTWNGAIPASGSITITITTSILPDVIHGTDISAQGTVSYDYFLNGSNSLTAPSYAPPLSEPEAPTVFTVRNFVAGGVDLAFILGTQALDINVLANDVGVGVTLSVISATNGTNGTVTVNGDGTLRYTPTGLLPAGGDSFTYTVSDGLGGNYIFTVKTRDFAEAIATYNGLTRPPVGILPRNELLGISRITISKNAAFTGSLKLAGRKYAFKGKFDSTGTAHFGKSGVTDLVLKRKVSRGQLPLADLALGLTLAPIDTSMEVLGTLKIGDSAFADITANRDGYSAKTNPVVAPLLGNYTVLFPINVPPNGGLNANQYPQGHGFARVKVQKNGKASLVGELADGTKISCANSLSTGNDWPLFVSLHKAKGALSGPVHFDPQPTTDMHATNLTWIRPASVLPPRYPAGWPDPGITVNLIGSAFVGPQRGIDASILPGLDPVDVAGNATLTLSNGNLPVPGSIVVSANVDTRNRVTFVTPPADLKLKATIASSGLIKGSYVHPVSLKSTAFRGVIFQKQNRAAGYFLGPEESGDLAITPK